MAEITIHTGSQGDCNRIHIDWFDHNNVRQETIIDVNVLPQDKPRTLEIVINGVRIGVIPPKK
jgi:hypothetical protein